MKSACATSTGNKASRSPVLHLVGILLFLLPSHFGLSQINGISLEGPPKPIETAVFGSMVSASNANWVSLHPYAYGRGDRPGLTWKGHEWQWWGESPEGTRESIRMAKESGLNVMLKPHIWLRKGAYTGHHGFEKDSDWVIFENDYRAYILEYARMAQEEAVNMFCIGNELGTFVSSRPEFWKKLIADIRTLYKGPLCYAANWDDYGKCPFWSDLDFIGVNAYFPLSSHASPDVKWLMKAWKTTAAFLKKASALSGKPILFTEYGYRNMDHCCREPWDSNCAGVPNEQAQANALTALYRTFWNQPWFAGGFLWKWHAEDPAEKAHHITQYSVQGKKALQCVRAQYAKP